MTDASGFLAAAASTRGVAVSKEGSQYVCTVTAENEHGDIDAEHVFDLAHEHGLDVGRATASVDRGELYVYVYPFEDRPASDGGGR